MPKGVYARKKGVRYGGPTRRPLAERFWAKVDVRGPDECWPWMGASNEDGYGNISEGGDHGRRLGAHRVAWSLKNGPIPPGMDICHSCDNPPCCNERHLSPAPHDFNVADKVAKGRTARPRGEANPHAKLTAAQVAEIRTTPGLHREIAARFGIDPSHVSAIKSGKKWKHL